VVTPPVVILAPQPGSIPPRDQNGPQGTSVLEIEVDEKGNVADAKVVKVLGYGLDEKALETVRTWKFRPAKANGHPTRVRIMVEVKFRLFQTARLDAPCTTPFTFARMNGKDPQNMIRGEFSIEVTSWWTRQKGPGDYSRLCAVPVRDARYAIVWRASPNNHQQVSPYGTTETVGSSPANKGFAEVYQVSDGQIQSTPVFTSTKSSAMIGFMEAVDFLIRQSSTAH
jgi:TonB family protein